MHIKLDEFFFFFRVARSEKRDTSDRARGVEAARAEERKTVIPTNIENT